MAAFRYWRLYVTAVNGDPASYGYNPAVEIQELEFRIGGVDQTTSGTAISSSNNPAVGSGGERFPSYAFDNDQWGYPWWADALPLPQWIGWDFGAGNEKEIDRVAFSLSTYLAMSPRDFEAQASIDGITWYTAQAKTGWSAPATARSFSSFYVPPLTIVGNAPPVIQNNGGGATASISYQENDTSLVTTVLAADADLETVAYGISGGDDAALFTIDSVTGELSFLTPPDYESPSDLNVDNVYEVQVSAYDGTDYDYQDLSVTIQDVGAGTGSEPYLSDIWQPVITLDGVDISSSLTGDISVDAEESRSRLASFLYSPPEGVIDASQWHGKAVTINYKTLDSSGSTLADNRLFTGVVNKALYSPETQLVSFDCTDDMQGKFEAMTQTEINALIVGSRWSQAVFGEYRDGWLYLENLLNTAPQSYDYNVDGVNGALVDWEAKVTPDFSFTSSEIVEGSISYSIAERRNLFNKYTIEYSYRFGRLLHRDHAFVWTGFVFNDYFSQSHELPSREMITTAAQSAGWNISTPIQFERLPASGAVSGWVISEELREILATRADWHAIKRWSQEVTETYTLTVQAPQSISWLGEVAYEEYASNQTELNADGWNDNVETPAGRTNSQDDVVQDKYNRTISRNDIETLIARARTEILASHRENYITAKVGLSPLIERHHTVSLNDNGVSGKGKVFSCRHVMDVDAGSAYSSITIAISLNGGAVAGGDSTITYPTEPATDPVTAAPSNSTSLGTRIGNDDTVANFDEAWTGFTGNYSLAVGAPTTDQIYPRRFSVATPEINQDAIDHIEGNASQTYSFDIPDESLTITVS